MSSYQAFLGAAVLGALATLVIVACAVGVAALVRLYVRSGRKQ